MDLSAQYPRPRSQLCCCCCCCTCAAVAAALLLKTTDGLLYSFIALLARIYQALRPVPGHPWYGFWHKDSYVELPQCDLNGWRLDEDSPSAVTAAAAKPYSSTRPSLEYGPTGTQAASAFVRHGWHIATITAMSTSSIGGASGHSTAGSTCVPSIASNPASNASDCSNIASSGSQTTTPLGRHSNLPAAHLATIFSMDLDEYSLAAQQDSQQQQQPHEIVCQLESQASLPAVPHVTASSLRYRPVGSDDGNSPPTARHNTSPSAKQHSPARSFLGSPSSSFSWRGSPKKQSGWDTPGSCPPPSSVVFEPEGQRVLLPASLVQQYPYFPMVLVQLPMYNEEAHCEVVIERACNMVYPRHRVVIQVRMRPVTTRHRSVQHDHHSCVPPHAREI